MVRRDHRPVLAAALTLLALIVLAPSWSHAQTGRFLGKEDILIYGLGLRVEPVTQTVPKDIATIVSTYLQAPQVPSNLPPFAPDAVVKGTLRGPGLQNALDLQVQPNSPFNIPPLTVAGIYTLENIRLESQGAVLLRSTPESVKITVIEKLLVTQITTRALTAAEIREKGIVFDSSNFQAYNFTAAFAVSDGNPIQVNFPVLLPSVQSVADVTSPLVTIGAIPTPGITSLKTVIPDTLKLATQIPNLTVLGFSLKVPQLKGQDLIVPPIPGVIVIPGDIGFLNQYFSVMLMVGNAAPVGSGLSVTDLQATIILPPGNDKVAMSADDPLRMAMTTHGEAPRVKAVVQAGPDGQLGTADDLVTLEPGDSGNAEFLVEGRREGSHTIEMSITGTLLGLPVGPVAIAGRAVGAVLVRNPTFTLTFTHPEIVAAGEPYSLDITVTNTSTSPANFVSVNLYGPNISGATLVGEPTREIESIPPGDSATVSFDLISRVTGKVTAATLDSDENVAGRFQLKTAVGADGVPLSPDSLVLPKEASALPKILRDAALGLLGKAWAVATAPSGALPKDLKRFSRQIVLDRAVEVAEAGLRVSLHEPTPDSAAQLLMDFDGSNYGRLPALYAAADLPYHRENYENFDLLRRSSVRGDVFAAAVASLLAPGLASGGPAAFHQALATKWNYRPGFVSVLLSSSSGPAPFDVAIIDAQGRRVGGTGTAGKFIKEIPFSDVLAFNDGGGQRLATLLVIATPNAGTYTIRLTRVPGTSPDVPSTLSILAPTADQNGDLQQHVFDGLSAARTPSYTPADADPIRFAFEIVGDDLSASPSPIMGAPTVIPDGPPTVVSVVQQAQADVVRCDAASPGFPMGRVVAVLFSEDVTAASVQDRLAAAQIAAFLPEANRAVGVALQPGRRIAFVAMREPFGPYVPRTMTVTGVEDFRQHALGTWTGPMEATIGDNGAVVSGRILQGDGTAVAGADVRLFAIVPCSDGEEAKVGIAAKRADGEGRYAWDFVNSDLRAVITAIDPATEEFRSIPFNISRPGQRMNVDIVLLGRGTFMGRVLSPNGRTPLPKSQLRVTSLTDHSQYGATTDDHGAFTIVRIPVGNIFVEAVNVDAKAHYNFSEYLPFAGAIVARDIILIPADSVQQRAVKYATLSGHVLKADGATAVADAPVVAYYQNNSQPGVVCPAAGDEAPSECPVGLANSAADGSFTIADIPAGSYRIYAFNQPSLAEGEVRYTLPEGRSTITILLSGGLATVRGTVVDSTGARVPNARVGGGLSLSTADANGVFELTDVPVGRRTIVAVSDALGVQGSATVDIVAAGEVVNVTIVMPAQGSIAGHVTLADGTTPAANVNVYVFQRKNGGVAVVGQATTDGGGAYRIDQILPDQYQVSAFAGDFSDGNIVPAVLRYNKQVLRVDVRFRGAGGRVSGIVYNANGNTPLVARVGITGTRLQIAGGRVGVAFVPVSNYTIVDTGFDGKFSFSGLFVGDFTLRAVGPFSPDPIENTARIETPGQQLTVNLRLQATSQVAGIVFQPDGVTPAANVNVTYKSAEFRIICPEDSDGEGCTTIPQGIQAEYAVTDATGHFLVPLVNAGKFTLSFEDPVTGKVAQATGTVRPGERAEMTGRLLGRGILTIHVIGSDGHTPIPGAKVEVRQPEFPKKELTMFADPQGVLVLGGGDALSEGEATILVRDVRNGFAGRASARITSDNEQVSVNVYIYDAWGTVSGTVYKSDGITPVPNAEVVVSVGGKALGYTVADANGAFTQDTVPLGPFSIDVFEAATGRIGYGSGRIDLDKQAVIVNVTEVAVGLVTGTALDSTIMAPLPGWNVTLSPQLASGRTLPTLQGMTAADGRFSFPGVSKGTFTLYVSKPGVSGSATGGGEIYIEGQLVDVPLLVSISHPLYGSIDGVVRNPDGAPASFATVSTFGPTYGRDTVAAADGSFSFTDLALGRYRIDAKAQSSSNAGSVVTDLAYSGDVVQVTIPMVGLTAVHGQVVNADNSPAAGVQVTFLGMPSTGCDVGGCSKFTDGTGQFSFIQLPARSFTVWASDPIHSLNGSVGGSLNPGEDKALRVVLQPSAVVQGRVLTAGGRVASSITCELAVGGGQLFVGTGIDGRFSFPAVPLGAYTLEFSDPIGSGIARRSGTFTGDMDFGDVVLDEAPPQVASLTPTASASRVPLNQVLTIVFSEPIDPAGVTASGMALAGPAGPVTSLLALGAGDTTVTLTPLSPLKDEARYTLKITGIKDRLAKVMNDYTASFTTVDITAPTAIDLSPAQGGSGVPIYSTIRIKFSEPVDPTGWGATPFSLSQGSTPITGRFDYLYGNTVVAFTPTLPLSDGSVYRVQLAAATDLAGNIQGQGLDFTFSTTDRTPPQIALLSALTGPTVIENTIARVRPEFGGASDVAVVDYYLNGAASGSSRTAPFDFAFQAVPTLGKPGDAVVVTAIATDTSGNRGVISSALSITVTPDQPPAVTITAPADASAFRNGAHVTVSMSATDDVGLATLAYRAQTGKPQDIGTVAVSPSATSRTATFAFDVSNDAIPGSTIQIQASAVDSKGQTTPATPVSFMVLDAVAPAAAISGSASGDKVRAGQSVTVTLNASDAGGLKQVTFAATGAAIASETRPVAGAPKSMVTAFSFTVSPTATTGDTIALDATGTDLADNTGTAARVILTVADITAPGVTLRTADGGANVLPGQTVDLVAQATDDQAITRIDLTGTGAFTVSDTRQVSPPSNSATAHFSVIIPSSVQPGAVLTLTARATDLSGNVSGPATVVLLVGSSLDVTMPASLVMLAGETKSVTVQMSTPAGTGGQVLTFATGDPSIATAPAAATILEGQTQTTITVTALSGGTTALRAYVQGALRASTTLAVQGGVISGHVLDDLLAPVAGAQLTVGTSLTAVSDGNGAYQVTGATGASVQVKAIDPLTLKRGSTTATLNQANGFAANVNVVLIAAGSVTGTVVGRDGVTPAGAGVQVDIYDQSNTSASLSTTFTDDTSRFEFPVVTQGPYVIEVRGAGGNRGRASVLVPAGQNVTANVAFLGTGTVTGVVRDAGSSPVPNAQLTLNATSLFGGAMPTTIAAGPDGAFTFDSVFVGNFYLRATDPRNGQAGVASGVIGHDQETVSIDVYVASFGSLQGTVYRSDGTTTVANASVTAERDQYTRTFATTDSNGHYGMSVVPLGSYTVSVYDSSTRGVGEAVTAVTSNGQQQTANVVLMPQGTLIVTVNDATGQPVAGATVSVQSANGTFRGGGSGLTGADGRVVVQHVLAGAFTVDGSSGQLSGRATGTLPGDATVSVTVQLQPVASIAGVVYLPNGQTPAGGRIDLSNAIISQTATLAADGSYRFDGLPLGEYQLKVYDESGGFRAAALRFQLLTPGQVATKNLTFVGLGTVSGRVFNIDSSSAGDTGVQVRSLNASFGRYQAARTDAAGYYQITGVPVGRVTITAGDVNQGIFAEASGTLATDGQNLVVDLLLKNNSTYFPVSLYDANGQAYHVSQPGTVRSNDSYVFSANGGLKLELETGGVTTAFAGVAVGTLEAGGQQVVARQPAVAGLDVTRRVFVPADGYFARYVDVLANPGTSAVTVNVWMTSYTGLSSLIKTSSGDAAISVADAATADRWFTIDDSTDGWSSSPALAFVFDGPGGAVRTSVAAFAPSNSAYWRWDNVTVPAGGSVAFMHFVVQQGTRAGAQASAERLVQLPPEALASLRPDELAVIRNFAVPADGLSALSALPALTGTITGQALDADGLSPVPFTPVTFTSTSPYFNKPVQVSADASGSFRIEGVLNGASNSHSVSLEAFSLAAAYPSTNLAAPVVTGAFASGQSLVAQNIVFTTASAVRGHVKRSDGTAVVSGTVTLAGTFNGSNYARSASIGSDGSFSFAGQPPIAVTLTASVPHSQGTANTGTAGATLASAQTQDVTITLPGTGSVAGTVKTGAGTAAADVAVSLSGNGFSRSMRTDTAGALSFGLVPAGTYTLTATEPASSLVTTATVTVAADQATTQDLQLVSVGIVRGTVKDANNAISAGTTIELTPSVTARGTLRTVTDSSGAYQFIGVPLGSFKVTATNVSLGQYGETTGSVTSDGQQVVADITMASNIVSLPRTTYDANSLRYDIQANGRIRTGYNDAFRGPSYATADPYGASMLSLIAGGAETAFAGAANALGEHANRELAITQTGIAGLDVTRKVYTPDTGYFIRYLEILSNPGAAPVTVGVKVASTLGYASFYYDPWWGSRWSGVVPSLATTSNGGTVLDLNASTPDRWAVFDDAQADIFDPGAAGGTLPASAFVFDGPGASRRVAAATYATPSAGLLSYQWDSVTVPPGGQVILMHFVLQQSSTAAATASVQRLVQLPPEAISGIADDERPLVANFAIPADGVSAVADLPALTGTVSGRVLDIDGTALASVRVSFVSNTPYFSRVRTVYSDGSGGFQFTSSFTDYQNTAIPVDSFTLTALHPTTQAVSPPAAGSFTTNSSTATQDVVFTNTAMVTGILRKQTGATVASQYVYLTNGSVNYAQYTDESGRFTFRGLPTGTWTINATLSGSQWLTLSATVSTVAGQTTTQDVTFAATGAVQGVVFTAAGAQAAYLNVYIRRPSDGASYGVYAYDGTYLIQDVPAGSYIVYANDPRTNARTEMPVTIAADQVTSQNITLPAAGSLQIQVNFARGVGVGGSLIRVMDVAGNGNFNKSLNADAAGRGTAENVAAGPVTVRAYYPSNYSFYSDVTTTLSNEGEVVPVTVTLPGVATVKAHVATSTGTGIANLYVYLYATSQMNSSLLSGRTDATGTTTLGLAAIGTSYTATSERYVSSYSGYVVAGRYAPFTPAADGDVATAEVVMPAVANATIAVVKPDGTPFGSAYLYLRNAYLGNFQYQGTTDGTTGLRAMPLPEGDNQLQVRDYNNGAALMNYTATIAPEDEGVAKTITITVGAMSGTVTGQVFSADGVTPVASARVYLLNALDGLQLNWMTTAADGRYTFSSVRPGSTGFIVRAALPSSVPDPTTVDVPGSFSTAGETMTVNVTMPFASVTLSGTVFSADGTTPIGSARVSFLNGTGVLLANATANGLGVYGPVTLLASSTGVTLRAYEPSYIVYGEQVQLPGPTGGTFTVNVTVPVLYGMITGKVVAADGQTGVRYASLQVNTAAGTLASFSANADGTFAYGTYLPSANGTLTASYSGGVVSDRTLGSIPVAFASANATLNVTMTLPLSVVKAYARQTNGLPLRSVYAPKTVGDDSQTRQGAAYDTATGMFVVLGTPTGPFRVYVTDGYLPYFTGYADATMGDITTPVQVDVTLPAIGTADVFVSDAQGQPAISARVTLSAPGAPFVTAVRTDATGHAVISAPAGPVSFQSCLSSGPCGIVSGTISGGQTTSFHLRGMPTGTLEGRMFKADGVTPYASSGVRVLSSAGSGSDGSWSASAVTDANGYFSMGGVPAGSGYLELNSSVEAIRVKTTVEAGRTATMQAAGNTGLRFASLTSNGASYSFDSTGRIANSSFAGNSPYYYSYWPSVNDYGYSPNGNLVRLTDAGAQLEFGPGNAEALVVQRKVSKPGSKPFLRYIETVRNPTSVPLPVSLLIKTNMPSLKVVTPPSATGNRYVITSRNNSNTYAAVAHVMGGVGTPRVKPGISLVTDVSLDYVWAAVVPPGGTVEFMHFSVMGSLADVAGLQAQAQALVDLTDPDALAGLSDEEKARILNFDVPGGKAENTGSISGTVLLQDGVTPLVGATVQAHDAITGFVRAAAVTDATGAFALNNVANGEEGVALTATLPAYPGQSAGAAVTFTQPGQTVSGLVLTFSAGEVSGQVTALGVGSANPTVLVSQTDVNGTVTTLRAYTSSTDGHYVVLGLKPGTLWVAVVDATGQVGTTVQGTYVAGTALALDVPLPAGPTCTAAPAGLRGFWRGEAGAQDSVHPGSDGTLENAAAIGAARVGNGFALDGTSALVQVPDPTGNLSPGTITVSAWVRFDSLDSASTPQAGEQYIAFKKKKTIGPNGRIEGYALAKTRVAPGDDRFAFWVVAPDEQNLWPLQIGKTTIEAGRFYHVVGTVDGTVGRLYVDGVLEATFPFAYPVDGGTGPLVIGGGDVTDWDPRCSGTIDEVQVLDRALTVDEVQSMYAATSAGVCADLTVLPALLSATYLGVSTTDTLRAVNGISPVAFGSTDAPPGLDVTAAGKLVGVPTAAGTFTFTATATDATNSSASRQFTKAVLPCLALPAGLVSLWSGEDNATDSMGVNNGTLERGQFDPGKVGRAFFGYDLRMSSQTPPLDLADTFTVEFWAWPVPGYNRNSTTESTSGTIGFPWNTTQRYAITPELRDGGAGAGLSVGVNGISVFEHSAGNLPSTLVYDTTISDWVHIALVYQNKTPTLYVNGVLVRTGLTSPQAHVYAPKSLGDGYGYGFYYGRLDEVALYNRALTGTEIGNIFAAGGEPRCKTVQK
jgi:5-hydroxyisourate hydrolase-like protein (transthyretin family)